MAVDVYTTRITFFWTGFWSPKPCGLCMGLQLRAGRMRRLAVFSNFTFLPSGEPNGAFQIELIYVISLVSVSHSLMSMVRRMLTEKH